MQVIIFIGLQGSGKSTFYRTYFAETHSIISKDLMKVRRGKQELQMRLIAEALRQGKSIVIDNTNPARADRAPIIEMARAYGAEVIGYYFQSRMEECQERNRLRVGKARVPEVALFATRKRLERPSLDEGFDTLCFVRIRNHQYEVSAWKDAA